MGGLDSPRTILDEFSLMGVDGTLSRDYSLRRECSDEVKVDFPFEYLSKTSSK